MKYTSLVTIVGALALAGCGGGSSSGGSSDHPLTGTWFGTADTITNQGLYVSGEITFNSDGDLTSLSVNGVDQNVTAEEVDLSNGIYTYEFDSGGRFGIRKYGGDTVAYVDSNAIVAIAEKGAESRPRYSLSDTEGSFSGKEFLTDSGYNLVGVISVDAEISGNSAPLDVTVSDSRCEASADLNLASSTAGVYTGTFTNISGTNCLNSGSVKHYLAPDKDSILTVACTSFSSLDVPQNCAFITATAN